MKEFFFIPARCRQRGAGAAASRVLALGCVLALAGGCANQTGDPQAVTSIAGTLSQTLAGAALGSHVANKRAAVVSPGARLNAVVAQARSFNHRLEKEIAALRTRVENLGTEVGAGAGAAVKRDAVALRARARQELVELRRARGQALEGGNGSAVAGLEAAGGEMEGHLAALEALIRRMDGESPGMPRAPGPRVEAAPARGVPDPKELKRDVP